MTKKSWLLMKIVTNLSFKCPVTASSASIKEEGNSREYPIRVLHSSTFKQYNSNYNCPISMLRGWTAERIGKGLFRFLFKSSEIKTRYRKRKKRSVESIITHKSIESSYTYTYINYMLAIGLSHTHIDETAVNGLKEHFTSLLTVTKKKNENNNSEISHKTNETFLYKKKTAAKFNIAIHSESVFIVNGKRF